MAVVIVVCKDVRVVVQVVFQDVMEVIINVGQSKKVPEIKSSVIDLNCNYITKIELEF